MLLSTSSSAASKPAKTGELNALKGKAAIANAKLAYALFRRKFAGKRWDALAAKGAQVDEMLDGGANVAQEIDSLGRASARSAREAEAERQLAELKRRGQRGTALFCDALGRRQRRPYRL